MAPAVIPTPRRTHRQCAGNAPEQNPRHGGRQEMVGAALGGGYRRPELAAGRVCRDGRVDLRPTAPAMAH
jgi:hypothetical protein